MAFQYFLGNALLALALGGLVGLERERAGLVKLIGVRSFALAALFGFLISLLASGFSKDAGVLLQAVGLIGIFILAGLYYYFRSIHSKAQIGITTALSLPFVYFIGALCGNGFTLEAATVTILTTLLLVEKKKLHAAVETLEVNEIQDGLILAVIAFVIYPLIPQQAISFLSFSLDLQLIWKLTLAASALSFASHMLIKYMKEKGVLIATVFGGMISSIATVYLFGKKAKGKPNLLNLAFAASSAGSYFTDILLLFVIPGLFVAAIPALATVVLCLIALAYVYRKGAALKGAPLFSNPLSLTFVLEFLLLILGVNIFLQLTAHTFGQTGILITSFLGGMASSSAAIAAIGIEFTSGLITAKQAAFAMLLSTTGSIAAKLALIQIKFKSLDKKMVLYCVVIIALAFLIYFIT